LTGSAKTKGAARAKRGRPLFLRSRSGTRIIRRRWNIPASPRS